jgi:hypothetical protein
VRVVLPGSPVRPSHITLGVVVWGQEPAGRGRIEASRSRATPQGFMIDRPASMESNDGNHELGISWIAGTFKLKCSIVIEYWGSLLKT